MQTIYLTIRCSFMYIAEAAKSVFKLKKAQPSAVARYCKGSAIMGNVYLPVAACMTLFFFSCQKESLTDEAMLNNTALSATSASAKKSEPPIIGSPKSYLNYGAFICPPTTGPGWLAFQQNVAGQLGITCLRGGTLVPGNGNPPTLLTSGYDVLFNFNCNNDAEDKNAPTPFVSNLTQYKIDLSSIIATFLVKPVVAVIENEEPNRFYYSGSAWDYIKQLNAAINVMHANGIKVANGGLTGGGLEYLVYQDLVDQGEEDAAEEFRITTHVTPNSPITLERAVFTDSLLLAYNQMDVDYVNFHWKCSSSDDVEALKNVVNYLKKRCNKPIISNELGQVDKDPNTLLSMIQVCTDADMPYMVWYSPDDNRGKKETPLQYSDATLTPTGVAYQDFLAQ